MASGETGVPTRRGIPEFWTVNLQSCNAEACRKPAGDAYTDVSIVEHDGALEPELPPGAAIPAVALLSQHPT